MPDPIIRPRPGDLEAATQRHNAIHSGEYKGVTEVCDLCGLSVANESIHFVPPREELKRPSTVFERPEGNVYILPDGEMLPEVEFAKREATLRSLVSDWQANAGSRPLGDPTANIWNAAARQLLKALDGKDPYL